MGMLPPAVTRTHNGAWKHRRVALVAMLLAALGVASGHVRAGETFTNPLLPSGPDPWVAQHGGTYYYTNTLGNRIALWKTRDMGRLAQAPVTVVWRAPASGPGSASVWAAELHFLDGKWYLYFTAADKAHDDDAHRHLYVLENASPDPTTGHWISRGALKTGYNGIDGTVFQLRGKLYFVYSAYVGDHSDLVIAPMSNPWTLAAPQVDIAHPTYAWEMQGGRKILEGPEFLKGPTGKLFLSYSASACWSDHYALGLLSAAADADPLDPASWHKSPQPVFAESPANGVYAPGHNGFFKSPDGKQTWIIYHANSGPGWKCGPRRSPRMQQVHWRADGTPDFGVPVKAGVPLAVPSGQTAKP
ncbi:family 43 glycosylhydrolase [Rhodanobacter glycinis]|uniref:Family 43 glycosylhydrolase n=2 Tax=Rhodanobacter glycinis TaxID=582702 RepID=A0A5B9DWH5_9GAMM|nr:family 43 glycosylhydrolase [Rhodanobacter glycinis]